MCLVYRADEGTDEGADEGADDFAIEDIEIEGWLS